MIRITQIKLPYDTKAPDAALKNKIKSILRLKDESFEFVITRRSIDARKKPDIFFVYTVDVTVKNERRFERITKKDPRVSFSKEIVFTPGESRPSSKRPIVCGFGPAGIFAAYILAQRGLAPIVLERGETAEDRTRTVEAFWDSNVLLPSSNVCFGEGGAGTFSDGKLNTGVKDPLGYGGYVLRTLVEFGAPNEILFDAKPHIGTDRLRLVIPAIRERICRLGGEVRFKSMLTDIGISGGALTCVTVNGSEVIPADTLILAIGHSARDTYRLLLEKNVLMTPKAFAVGFRIEHPQSMIDRAMYQRERGHLLPPSPYTLAFTPKDAYGARGRGVYSFCMCPGGYVVNSSTEEGGLCVNGMSCSERDGENANSAIVVAVSPSDYMVETKFNIPSGTLDAKDRVLSGMFFQQEIEKRAYRAGNGCIPQQLFGDFLSNKRSSSYGGFSSHTKGRAVLSSLRGILPCELEESFCAGMREFSRSIPGFDREDAILSGIEGRTSSPVRIERDRELLSSIQGIYPCGEGAGYAGGIASAAMDGIRVAESFISKTSRR